MKKTASIESIFDEKIRNKIELIRLSTDSKSSQFFFYRESDYKIGVEDRDCHLIASSKIYMHTVTLEPDSREHSKFECAINETYLHRAHAPIVERIMTRRFPTKTTSTSVAPNAVHSMGAVTFFDL